MLVFPTLKKNLCQRLYKRLLLIGLANFTTVLINLNNTALTFDFPDAGSGEPSQSARLIFSLFRVPVLSSISRCRLFDHSRGFGARSSFVVRLIVRILFLAFTTTDVIVRRVSPVDVRVNQVRSVVTVGIVLHARVARVQGVKACNC